MVRIYYTIIISVFAPAGGSFIVLPYFRKKFHRMETPKKNKGLWWLVFFASTIALISAIYLHWEWLTLILPFQCTSFVKAMDIM